jgi:hypothetical protein
MRITAVCLVALGAALAATAAANAASREPFRGSLEGDWETVIQSPRRPWAFVIHFTRTENGWAGAMTFPGYPDFPLSEVRAETTSVHFRVPPELGSIVFDGTLAGEVILGLVLERGESVPTRLTRSIELPPPANRLEAWRQDLDFAATHLREYDRSFSAEARVGSRAIAALNLICLTATRPDLAALSGKKLSGTRTLHASRSGAPEQLHHRVPDSNLVAPRRAWVIKAATLSTELALPRGSDRRPAVAEARRERRFSQATTPGRTTSSRSTLRARPPAGSGDPFAEEARIRG